MEGTGLMQRANVKKTIRKNSLLSFVYAWKNYHLCEEKPPYGEPFLSIDGKKAKQIALATV
jgi:hypothetical protein